MLKTKARTINNVTNESNTVSVLVRLVALDMKVFITGINATTRATSTTVLVISIAPLQLCKSLLITLFIEKR
jgi:hypothetical protein